MAERSLLLTGRWWNRMQVRCGVIDPQLAVGIYTFWHEHLAWFDAATELVGSLYGLSITRTVFVLWNIITC